MDPRLRLRAVLLPLLLAALAGCEPVVEPAPDRGPEVAHQVLGSAATVADDEGNEYTLVEGNVPPLVTTREVSRLIGASGGTLNLAGHTLTVPEGAVSVPTVFVLTIPPSGRVEVELQALVSTLSGLVDVGEEGFDRPVTLSLTYAWASNVTDPSTLKILHLREDGSAEPLPTTVDPTGKTVTARLHHFSRYCMAIS